jgi:hypothetical protein
MRLWKKAIYRFLYRIYTNDIEKEETYDDQILKMYKNACYFWGAIISITGMIIGVVFISLMLAG